MNTQTTETRLPVATGLILAGGKGTRMAMQDKGLLKLAGKTLVEIKVASLASQVNDIIISANRNLETYNTLKYPVVVDESNNYSGPLAGIAAAWKICQTDWLITCPCDTPLLCDDYAQRILQTTLNNNAQVGVAYDGERAQNTFLAMHRSTLPSLTTALAQQNYAVFKWLAVTNHVRVDFSNEQDMFINFNTTEELNHYASKLS